MSAPKTEAPRRFALIIGAAKCGTTSLFHMLARHPRIAGCTEKEPRFFAHDEQWARGFAWYQRLWQWEPAQHHLAIEASPQYTMVPAWPNAADRIAQIEDAHFQFIYLMRHPLERLESQLAHDMARHRRWSRQNFEHAVDYTRYATQLDHYRRRFGAEAILPLLLDDLKADPESTLDRICGFLGLEPEPAILDGRRTRNTREGQLDRIRPRMWEGLRTLGAARRLYFALPERFRARVGRHVGNWTYARHRLTAEQRAEALSMLRGDLHRLQAEYGIDVRGRWDVDPDAEPDATAGCSLAT